MTIKQKGISLIELMIALGLSSLLILGITQIFIDNKRNQVFQANQLGNLENARFTELLLNEYLGRAGYRRNPDALPEYVFPRRAADSDCSEFERGSIVTTATNGLCLRYQPLVSGELDCTGQATTAFNDDMAFSLPPTNALVVLAIKYEPASNAALLDQGTLQCKNVSLADSEYVDLVTNVADFSLSFGFGPDELMEKRIESFGSSGSGYIRAVQYSILLASQPNQRDGGDSPVLQAWLDDINDAEHLPAGDSNRIYQIAQSTQTLRNYMP